MGCINITNPQHTFIRTVKLIAQFVALFTLCLFFKYSSSSEVEEFDRNKVKIGQYVYNPLFTESGKGLLLDMLSEAYKAVGITPEITILPLNRVKLQLLKGEIDIFGGGGTTNFSLKEQQAYGIGTGKYFKYMLVLAYYPDKLSEIKKKRIKKYDVLSDLKGFTFGETEIYPGNEMLREAGLIADVYATGKMDILYQQFQMLRTGRFDTTQMSLLSGIVMLQKRFPKLMRDFGLTKPFTMEPLTRFYNKNNPKSVYFNKKAEEGMALLMVGGRESKFYQILEGYWGKNNVPAYILPETFKKFGIDKLNLPKALSYQRDENGKITNLEK
jgi:hypothetical protein